MWVSNCVPAAEAPQEQELFVHKADVFQMKRGAWVLVSLDGADA